VENVNSFLGKIFMPKNIVDEAVKRPNSKDNYNNEKNLLELMECVESPLYFMKNFMKIQHATKGSVKFDPFPFQERIVNAFATHRNVVCLCGRQLGKSLSFKTKVLADDVKVEIGSLVPQTFHMRLVSFLENLLLKLI